MTKSDLIQDNPI